MSETETAEPADPPELDQTHEVEPEINVHIQIPPIHHDALERLSATGLYSKQVPCTNCSGDTTCETCGGDETVFEDSVAAVAEILVRRALNDMIERGGFQRMRDFNLDGD